ncbi:hypothetical protein [Maricaulis sp.]|uniref:hypothetical protein n=1 Tax=Maricaulis sp. TaxID=1486257 RepID=UPI003A8EB9CB
MSSFDRFVKAVPAGSLLLAAALLVSCGGVEDGQAPAAPDAATPAGIVEPATGTDGQAADGQASDGPAAVIEPVPLEPAPAVPGKGAAPIASVAEPAYVGTWGVDLAQCSDTQEYEWAPMVLRADGYDQYEAHCDFELVDQTGPAQWHITGHCSVEGDEQPLDYNMAIVDGDLVHWSGDARKDAWTLVRCPE